MLGRVGKTLAAKRRYQGRRYTIIVLDRQRRERCTGYERVTRGCAHPHRKEGVNRRRRKGFICAERFRGRACDVEARPRRARKIAWIVAKITPIAKKPDQRRDCLGPAVLLHDLGPDETYVRAAIVSGR